MRKLFIGVALTVAVMSAGCDDRNGGEDAGRDSGVRLPDAARIDTGVPTPTDAGGGTDSGTPGTCGPTGACSVSEPTSCGTGMACLMVGGGGNPWMTVCAASGVLGQGEACDPAAANQCQEGFQCFSNVCQKICCSNSDCDPGVLCQQLADTNGAGLCTAGDTCSIIDPDSCEDGEGCYPLGSEGDVQCIEAGTATVGMACNTLNGCVAGYGCAGSPGACRQYCVPGEGAVCETDFMCVQLTNGSTPILGIGVCVPMTTP